MPICPVQGKPHSTTSRSLSIHPSITIIILYLRVWGNPGSTRNLQPLVFLSFVAWRTRQVGARFDGEPSDGNDRSASKQREVLRRQNTESTVITCQRDTWLPASLSSESTETPQPLLVQQDTISNTSGTATVYTNLHEKIWLRNGRKCTCDQYIHDYYYLNTCIYYMFDIRHCAAWALLMKKKGEYCRHETVSISFKLAEICRTIKTPFTRGKTCLLISTKRRRLTHWADNCGVVESSVWRQVKDAQIYIKLLLAKAQRGEKKTHSVEEAQRGMTAK